MNAGRFAWGTRTYIMGILNVTDDSFSGDGLRDVDAAVVRGLAMLAAGADVVDIGGESTRPGANPIDAEEEERRVVPVVAGLRARTDAPLSVDTYRASVAAAALTAGATIVNDVWGFQRDPSLPGVVACAGAWAVAMHNRSGTVVGNAMLGTFFAGTRYDDVVADVMRELQASVMILREAGLPADHIILDPGIGFGKTPEQNLELLRRLRELRALGYPLLVGTSRKSVIGVTLGLPPNQREEGTAATVALAVNAGVDMVRVHDVATMAQVARMADLVVRGDEP